MIIIGIAGASGSGKTTLAKQLADTFPETDVNIISADAYYKEFNDVPIPERENINFDHPDTIDFDLLIAQLSRLKSGEAIDLPDYDFSTSARTDKTHRIEPKKITFFEGVLTLHHPKVVELLDLKIYVDTCQGICLARRIERDMRERGRTAQSVVDKYEKQIRPMWEKFIAPCKQIADIVSKNNQFDMAFDIDPITARISQLSDVQSPNASQLLGSDNAASPSLFFSSNPPTDAPGNSNRTLSSMT